MRARVGGAQRPVRHHLIAFAKPAIAVELHIRARPVALALPVADAVDARRLVADVRDRAVGNQLGNGIRLVLVPDLLDHPTQDGLVRSDGPDPPA